MKTWKTQKGVELQIMDIKGKDYMQVQWRLVWFRSERPDWSIETEYQSMTEKDACCGATIRNEQGRIIAMAHKYEDKAGFPDYREKAETGAIGRALALVGYGTQFCTDELDEGRRLADSPTERNGAIKMEQPGPNDGNTEPLVDKIAFGKWRGRSYEECYNLFGRDQVESYMRYLEESATKKGVPLGAQAVEFIASFERLIGALENQEIK